MPTDKRFVNVEINSHDTCAECGSMQPVKKSEYGEIHDGDCSKHDADTCLVCNNIRNWEEGK